MEVLFAGAAVSACFVAAAVAVVAGWVLLWRGRGEEGVKIPWARGGVPILGHSLLYRADAPSFLRAQCDALGPVFRVNFAGKRLVVVGGGPCREATRQIAVAGEDVLSAKDAVADVGFLETLGRDSVYEGTDLHRRVLREVLAGGGLDGFPLGRLAKELRETAEETFPRGVFVPDLLVAVRRCVLRVMVRTLVSARLDEPVIIEAMMVFQDAVEDATAKAAVLPRVLALPLVLWPVQRERRGLERRIASILASIPKDKERGPWLVEMASMAFEKQARFVVGLAFAAHKNPAIGAAQAFVFHSTEATPEDRRAAKNEATSIAASFNVTRALGEAVTLRRATLEALRLTAHSIGAVRKTRRDFDLDAGGGRVFRVRRGETIAISHICPNTDPRLWKDAPAAYRPERFAVAATDPSLAPPVDDYAYTVFSQGVHRCPGRSLALAVVELLLAILVHLDLDLDDRDNVPKLNFERATLAQRDGPVAVRRRP